MSVPYYKLIGRNVVQCKNTKEWIIWYEANFNNRVIAKTVLSNGRITVSTVFLSIEHLDGMLFETLVFGGEYDEEMWRYRTIEEAEIGHQAVVDAIRILTHEE